jgi:hypothetical protein
MSEKEVGLADAISAARRELSRAVLASDHHDRVGFRYEKVEIELELVLSREGSGDAGVRLWAVSLGGKSSRRRATTHRIHVTLQPFDRSTADGRPLANEPYIDVPYPTSPA